MSDVIDPVFDAEPVADGGTVEICYTDQCSIESASDRYELEDHGSSSSDIHDRSISTAPALADATYKVLLLGDTGVGKTSLIRALTGKPFSHNMLTTIGIDFVSQHFEVDSAKICLQIWDTAGQERFRSLTKFQYRGTKGLLLVYDITSRDSFETLSYWINTVEEELEQQDEDTVPVIVVGNKCDLKSKRQVAIEEGRRIVKRNSLFGFYETSAAHGTNVRECFQQLALTITDIYDPQLCNKIVQMSMYKKSDRSNEGAKRTQHSTRRDVTENADSSHSSAKKTSTMPTVVVKIGNEPSQREGCQFC